MSSLRRFEGYFMMDHRAEAGISDELVATVAGPAAEMPAGAGKGLFECAVVLCSHCQVGVMINPLRTRERAYCPKCDHYICDACGVRRAASGGECFSFKKLIDAVQEQAGLQEQASRLGLILPGNEELEQRINEIVPPAPTPPPVEQQQVQEEPRIIIST